MTSGPPITIPSDPRRSPVGVCIDCNEPGTRERAYGHDITRATRLPFCEACYEIEEQRSDRRHCQQVAAFATGYENARTEGGISAAARYVKEHRRDVASPETMPIDDPFFQVVYGDLTGGQRLTSPDEVEPFMPPGAKGYFDRIREHLRIASQTTATEEEKTNG